MKESTLILVLLLGSANLFQGWEIKQKLNEPRHVTMTICHQYLSTGSKIIECKPMEVKPNET